MVVLTFAIKKLGFLIKSLLVFIFRYVYFLRFLSKVLVTHKEVPLVVALLIMKVLRSVLHLYIWHVLHLHYLGHYLIRVLDLVDPANDGSLESFPAHLHHAHSLLYHGVLVLDHFVKAAEILPDPYYLVVILHQRGDLIDL